MERLDPQAQDFQSQQIRQDMRHESAPARMAQGAALERRSAVHLAAGGGIQNLPPKEVARLSKAVGNDALCGMMRTGGPVQTIPFTLQEQTQAAATNVIKTVPPGLMDPSGLCGTANNRLPINLPDVRGRGLTYMEADQFLRRAMYDGQVFDW